MEKVRKKVNTIRKKINSEPVYKEKKKKGKFSAIIRGYKIPKKGSQCICLSVILIYSGFRTGKNYYLQVFLDEYKYVVKKDV